MKLKTIIITAVFSFLLLSCENPGEFNIFYTADDVELGARLDAEIKSNSAEYDLLPSDHKAVIYLQAMVDKINQSPLIKYRKLFTYQISIINNDKVVNAFATPGAYIYVYTGLIKFLDNEAALAGVLGHEIAHAELRHATSRMTKAYGIGALISIALGEDPSQAADIAANLLSGLYLLSNSRADELESDEYSFNYLRQTEYYAGGIKYFFEKIGDNMNSSFLEDLLSTHPDPDERLGIINSLITDAGLSPPAENNLFAERYQGLKAMLP